MLRFMAPALLAVRCLPAAVSVTILSNPAAQVFTADGSGCSAGGYTAPQALNWTPGASCTVTFVSPSSGGAGRQFVFNSWQDGAATNPRTIVAPAQSVGRRGPVSGWQALGSWTVQ